MSDNKYNPTSRKPKLSIADQNFAKAAKDKLYQKFGHIPHTPREMLEAKAKTLSMTVHDTILPILKAGGGIGRDNLDALEATLFSMFVQGFDSTMFTKEELIHLCAILHSQALRASVESDPYGSGTPDLMSLT